MNEPRAVGHPRGRVTGLEEEEGAVQCTHNTVQCTLWLPPYNWPGSIRPTSRCCRGRRRRSVRGWRRRRWREGRMDKWFGWQHEKAHHAIKPMKKQFPSSRPMAPSKDSGLKQVQPDLQPCLRHHRRLVDHRFGHRRQSVRSTAVAPSNRTKEAVI